jgi:hypothetical protein
MTITPLVNLNGTSPEALIEQQSAVVAAADQLIRALHHATPHGRDYHLKPGPENWTELARREHQARIACVQQIIKDAHDIAASVMEQRRR